MSANFFKRFSLVACSVLMMVASIAATAAEHVDPPFNFLALADIHFDPFTTCYKQAARPCPTLTRLMAAPVNQWSQILLEVDTQKPGYRQDTNYRLLDHVLSQAQNVAAKHEVKFVLVLGDTLSHDFRMYYRRFSADKSETAFQTFAKKTLEFINLKLTAAFPDTNVLMVTGNNDTYSLDYQSVPAGNFFRDTAGLWSALLQDPSNRATMRTEFARAGYYALTLPGHPELRIIALNTVLFSDKSRGKRAAKAADEELDWLHQQLVAAKNQHQHVLLALHIPPKVDAYATRRWRLFTLRQFWRAEYLQRFQQDMLEFYPEIIDIMAGHLHYDWLQSFEVDSRREITVYGVPSVSPIYGNEPAFKLYRYTPVLQRIEDVSAH